MKVMCCFAVCAVLDHVLITVLAILMAVMAVTILGTLLTLLCCHYRWWVGCTSLHGSTHSQA